MAPIRNNTNGMDRDEEDFGKSRVDRKIRKPLVEKKRRARINESLQELRVLMADTDDLQSKMENAEVLEVTVKRVESILQSRAQEEDAENREACERFAAGYIQCMHEVHTFISNCPGVDPTVAAELLNHLLESMPLNDQDRLQVMLSDIAADNGCPNNNSTWPLSEYATLISPTGGRGLSSGRSSALSPAPSTTSTDDLCSDLDETSDSDQSQIFMEEADSQGTLSPLTYYESVWRPW